MAAKRGAILFFILLFVRENRSDYLLDALKEKIFGEVLANAQRTFISSFLDNCTGIKMGLDLEHQPNMDYLYLDIWNSEGDKKSINLNEVPHRLTSSKYYNKSLPMAIFIHGFLSSSEGAASSKIVQELLIRGDTNVLALNSEHLVKISYLISSTNVFYIGRQLGIVLADIEELTSIHIIGHSLGAHIAGFAGKAFTNKTGKLIDRISGLDPAGPCYFQEESKDRLSKGDAKFVDVIHTDMGVYGIDSAIGDADFFPNGGFDDQPGCARSSFCSHSRSWLYFAETINSPRSYPALKCPTWSDFRSGECRGGHVENMGWDADPRARGLYFLRTDDAPPFGKGLQGTRASNMDFLMSFFKI